MKSKFKILLILVVSYFSVLPILVIYLSFNSPFAGMLLPILFLLFVLFFWLTVFRIRAFHVVINEKTVIFRRYFGIGKPKIYRFDELDGFVTLFESGRLGITESVLFLKNGKSIGCISSFYLSNFEKMKLLMTKELPDLGERKPNFSNDCAELFQ